MQLWRCGNCGYRLEEQTRARCPECGAEGAAVAASEYRLQQARPRLGVLVGGAAMGLAMVAAPYLDNARNATVAVIGQCSFVLVLMGGAFVGGALSRRYAWLVAVVMTGMHFCGLVVLLARIGFDPQTPIGMMFAALGGVVWLGCAYAGAGFVRWRTLHSRNGGGSSG